ncbi:bifunctional phosphopantothenoylcysteine decarboxylase/phosphopantothenate--cysteine ligase CoaBC [Quadrisphaera sp. GCM10027208]|uniref:bifunctional phosphopantothenoylcysteine decarboxylase/phosphopantothenate--cysteine ligase CoaBC n=1 Tax=Quadrisphaera sp. GCM10027208 TaxID=3273423 RepID=UPI00362397DD
MPPSPRVVLGVSGGIAAYKACSLLRCLTETGHRVRVVPTRGALEFVGAATWAALSGEPVTTEVWDDVHAVPHVRLGQDADLVVVAPATADLLARAAHGRADDLLTATLLTARCPVLMAPAMHTEMWEHPATQANVATLRERGVVVLEPAAGRLTGADSGAGRLPEPEAILTAARRLLARPGAGADLAGRHVVVSAGGTREPLDPVRYLGNRSSGRQGYALAATAAARGARVTLVAANTDLPDPAGVHVVRVGTARQLADAVRRAAADADVVVMAAAVADFRPARPATTKIKKSADDAEVPVVELVRNPDVLAGLVTDPPRPGQLVVGFAAETGDETGDVLEHARAKLARKGCDLLVVNEVGDGRAFGTADNTVVLLDRDGGQQTVGPAAKEDVADAVWDAVLRLAGPRAVGGTL